jgi:hypothetical protein
LTGSTSTSFGTRSLDGPSTLNVDPATGGQQHSQEKDNKGTTDQTVIARGGALYLADLKTSGQGVSVEFRPSPPVLLVPAAPRVGEQWSWQTTSTDGSYHLTAQLRVASLDDTVTVGGRTEHADGITAHLVVTGSNVSMTTDQRDEFKPGLPVLSEHASSKGTAYGVAFRSDSTRRLDSVTPH